ncbi:hypothetical protein EN780_06405 [Mesorhizobium sp. M4B.F.Ca.ET.089.01.1.1]|nr:hypothetical protein EN780_06405 [Mesorhizobium sp. M4B.F.Ca.ET.089.01.1.1]
MRPILPAGKSCRAGARKHGFRYRLRHCRCVDRRRPRRPGRSALDHLPRPWLDAGDREQPQTARRQAPRLDLPRLPAAVPERGSIVAQMLILGAIFILCAFLSLTLISMLAGTLSRWLRRSDRGQVWLNKIAGLVFVGLALKLSTSHRSARTTRSSSATPI